MHRRKKQHGSFYHIPQYFRFIIFFAYVISPVKFKAKWGHVRGGGSERARGRSCTWMLTVHETLHWSICYKLYFQNQGRYIGILTPSSNIVDPTRLLHCDRRENPGGLEPALESTRVVQSSLVAQRVKDTASSLLWWGLIPDPCHGYGHKQTRKKKKTWKEETLSSVVKLDLDLVAPSGSGMVLSKSLEEFNDRILRSFNTCLLYLAFLTN